MLTKIIFFMKNNCILKQNKFSEKTGIVLHFANLFHFWFNRRLLDSHICFYTFNLLQCYLVEVNEEDRALHRYIIGRKRYALVALVDTFEYSSLILHQDSRMGSFLKANCNVESETVSMNYLYSIII